MQYTRHDRIHQHTTLDAADRTQHRHARCRQPRIVTNNGYKQRFRLHTFNIVDHPVRTAPLPLAPSLLPLGPLSGVPVSIIASPPSPSPFLAVIKYPASSVCTLHVGMQEQSQQAQGRRVGGEQKGFCARAPSTKQDQTPRRVCSHQTQKHT